MKIKKDRGGGFLDESRNSEFMTPEKKRKLEELELARKMKEHVQVQSGSLTKRDRVCRKIIEWGILGLIVWSPLPAASVYEWSILVIQLVVLAMLGAYLLMKEKPQNHAFQPGSTKWIRYAFLGLFGIVFFQMIPLPNILIKILSPHAYGFREIFRPDFSAVNFISFSLIPTSTFRQGLELLTYFLLGFLIVKTITQQRQLMRILYVLVGMGVFQALYGFFELYNRNPRILFYEKKYYLDTVTGTFVNRNHLSGYLEMVIPLAIGIMLARTDFFALSGLKLRERILRLSGKGIYVTVFIPLGIVLMSLAVIFSKSRSGVFLLILTFLLFFELSVLFFPRERERRGIMKKFLIGTLVIITFFALYIGIDSVIARFSMDNLLREARPVFWKQTADIVGDFPVFGTGLGTFVYVYPIYEEIGIQAQVSHAHNDYLEYLSELGIFGFALLFGGILYLLVRSFLVWRERRHPLVKGLGLGGIVSITIILIHSISDFNLHIPANMLLFSVVLSLTIVIVTYRSQEGPNQKNYHQGNEERDEKEELKIFVNSKEKSNLRLAFSLFMVVILIGIAIVSYWNQHLYYKGKDIEDSELKIQALDKANSFFPLNDLVFYELGRENFSLGVQNIENNELRDAYLEESVKNYHRALSINPISSFGHFYLAQTLYYMGYLNRDGQLGELTLQEANGEYKKAALLSGHNSQLFHEVGKVFLSLWDELSEEDREFAVEILRKRVQVVDEEGLLDLMSAWEMNLEDYTLMRTILPVNIYTYRLFAQFLGEKSLSVEERHDVLSLAESMEFEQARQEFKAGENAFMYLRTSTAANHYQNCLRILEQIKFYQELYGRISIDEEEFKNIFKTSHLKLAKCCQRQRRELSEIQRHVLAYLEFEEDAVAVGELVSYLQKQALLGENLDDSREDLDKLYFHIYLYYKQNRYRDVMRMGKALLESFIVVPEDEQKDYMEVLRLIGDSYQRMGHIYDATEFYNRALMIEPDNLETLLSLRQNFERLREDDEVRKITERIEGLMTPRHLDTGGVQIQKGRTYTASLILDGRAQRFNLFFKSGAEHLKPLISIFFNERIVWEDYVEDEVVSVSVQSEEGENRVVVSPINMDIQLDRISYE